MTLQEDGSEDDLSYIKLINYGERVLTNRSAVSAAANRAVPPAHHPKHTIYLCRHGQSEYNTTGRLGGNSPITERGWVFAEILARFAAQHVCNLKEVKTPQSTLCSDLDDPYLAATPGRHWARGRIRSEGGVRSIQAVDLLHVTIDRRAHPAPGAQAPDGGWEACRRGCIVTVTKCSRGTADDPDEVAVAHPQATTLRKMDKIGYGTPGASRTST